MVWDQSAMRGPVAVSLSRQAVALTLANRPAEAEQAVAAVTRSVYDGSAGIEGRHAIDVAFNLALAGAADSPVLDMLAVAAEEELRTHRWRRRGWSKPRSAYTLVQLAERAAAAGLIAPLGLYGILGELLAESGEFPQVSAQLGKGSMWLGNARAASWLYRAARRQTKLTTAASSSVKKLPTRSDEPDPAFPHERIGATDGLPGAALHPTQIARSSARHEPVFSSGIRGRGSPHRSGSWLKFDGFHDASKPLVVDLGCGYGVGVLTAAAAESSLLTSVPGRPRHAWPSTSARPSAPASRSTCVSSSKVSPGSRLTNYLGCDLSPQGISYARGVARRWRLDGRVSFMQHDALSVLRGLEENYDGPVVAVALCCPSPYRFAPSVTAPDFARESCRGLSGNSQLPLHATSDSFLGNAVILAEAARLLVPGGRLLISSNAEDVAVTMAATAADLGLVVDCADSGKHASVSRAYSAGPVHDASDACEGAKSKAESSMEPSMELSMEPSMGAASRGAGSSATQASARIELSRRSKRWRQAGGCRAEGAGWRVGAGWGATARLGTAPASHACSQAPHASGRVEWGGADAIRRDAWSETELAHAVDGAAVHRLLLRKL